MVSEVKASISRHVLNSSYSKISACTPPILNFKVRFKTRGRFSSELRIGLGLNWYLWYGCSSLYQYHEQVPVDIVLILPTDRSSLVSSS